MSLSGCPPFDPALDLTTIMTTVELFIIFPSKRVISVPLHWLLEILTSPIGITYDTYIL